MLGMLVEVLCRYAITTRRRFPREGNITLEDLMGRASDFDARAVTVEALTSLRHLLPIAVGIITIITTIRSVGLSCSHATFCVEGKGGLFIPRERIGTRSLRGRVAPLFCTAPAPSPQHVRWGGRYFQQFFAQCGHKPACLAPPACSNLLSPRAPGRGKAGSRPSGNRHRYGCRETPRSDARCRARSTAAQTGGRRRAG